MSLVVSARWLPFVRFLAWLGVAEEVHLKPALPKPPELRPLSPTLVSRAAGQLEQGRLAHHLKQLDMWLGLAFGSAKADENGAVYRDYLGRNRWRS